MNTIASTVLGIGQDQLHHNKELNLSRDLHHAEMLQTQRFHEEEMRQTVDLFKHHVENQWDMHNASMQIATDLARRETMRDVWQQRQFLSQAVLVTAALLFSSAFIAISQPVLPSTDSPNPWFFGIYGVSLALATLLFTTSMWLSFKVQNRMGLFNANLPDLVYSCGGTHADFNDYFSCHCESLRLAATFTLVFGMISLLCGASGLQLVQAAHRFKDTSPGAIFASIAGLTIILILFLELAQTDKVDQFSEYGGLAHQNPIEQQEGNDAPPSSANEPYK